VGGYWLSWLPTELIDLFDDWDESPKDRLRETLAWEIEMKLLLVTGMMKTYVE
jgi:hypothetical protein